MELINPKFKRQKQSIWVIIHVNVDYLYRIEDDLNKFADNVGMKKGSIASYVPTVRVLRKKLKGNLIFETLPLLFTYGFIQMPKIICSPDNMIELKKQVLAIHSYVNDLSNSRLAFATQEEIVKLYSNIIDYSVYDAKDLENLTPGKIITLHGYPFDNLQAKVIFVDFEEQKVNVELVGDNLIRTAQVDFDNVIYSLYHQVQHEGQFKEVLLGDLKTRYKTNTTKYE